ncbi:unnamed protein product [Hermetia illucens]|uniref:Uncharacterized protein n=1 Tax=Hermetia illucens TaxID=343691 RepID=A0A7R8UMU0_HERIL|nr:unnamed protein product [Hermetia illucens]
MVDITPVAQGRSHLTSATATGGKDVASGGAGGSGGGGGLASSLFRFGSSSATSGRGVCICNAQCRLGDGALGAKIHHGSLDRLLHGELREPGQKEQGLKAGPPQQAIEGPSLSARQQFDKGVEVEKFYHQINGDIFEITRRVKARDEETMEQKVIKRRGSSKRQPHPHKHELVHAFSTSAAEKPVPPPRISSRQKSAEAEYEARKQSFNSEWFDRAANLRHSARSAESGPIRDETIEWLERQQHPQRTSSGPSGLAILKDEMPPDWMTTLPRKQSVPEKQPDLEQRQPSLPKSLKEELSELLKKPLTRQHSGPEQLSLLKHDILEWLAKLQSTTGVAPGIVEQKPQPKEQDTGTIPKQPRATHRRNGSGGAPRSFSQEPEVKHRKRNSLGPAEKEQEFIPDWVPYPLYKLQSLGKQGEKARLPSQGSCVDLHRKSRDRTERSEKHRSSRKLRHSASEVVTPTIDRQTLEKPVQQPGIRKETQYQYIPKEPTSGSSKRERERSRRHQTQRSATVTDMFASKSGSGPPRKSSSAERAPRSRSPPCTDPACRVLTVCTDPCCCFVEYYDGRAVVSHTPLTICHECQYNSLPRCKDPKCINTARIKCNSLPRCAADFHRIRTQPIVHHRSNSQPNTLSRGDSRASIPRTEKPKAKNGSNNKLMKSLSAASLNNRRRRHKTVHFGENLLREVCQNRKLIKPTTPSGSAPMQPNIQMLYNFVEGVLSAWVDDEDDQVKSGAESEPERGVILKPIHRCNRLRLQTIRRVVAEAAQLRGTLKLGNSRYRHRHWSGTAMECNERFLRKVCWGDHNLPLVHTHELHDHQKSL